nr:ABC transporter C family member 12-like [Leptinotarsa decemlineata]
MDAGSVVEFDHPHVLLQNRDGMLFDLVKKTGPGVSDTLKKVAQENYEARKSNAAQSQKPKAVQPGGSVQSQRDNATQPLRDSDEEEESPRNG